MSVLPGVDVLLEDLLHDNKNGADLDDESGDGQDVFVNDDARNFFTKTIHSANEHDIYSNPVGQPSDKEVLEAVEQGGRNEVDIPPADAVDAKILPPPPITENGNAGASKIRAEDIKSWLRGMIDEEENGAEGAGINGERL